MNAYMMYIGDNGGIEVEGTADERLRLRINWRGGHKRSPPEEEMFLHKENIESLRDQLTCILEGRPYLDDLEEEE